LHLALRWLRIDLSCNDFSSNDWKGRPLSAAAAPVLRRPSAGDGAQLWRLVGSIGALERNSAYAYLLLCTHFADTCLVAEIEGELVGFVLAYRPPTEPDTVFVWQVGVGATARGRGLARRLLDALIERPACRGVRTLCATVSPDNAPSQALFRSFARARGIACADEPGFAAASFPEPHPDETLLRIGPLKGST
jgi:L-2,4-diaminobutyric acid acetyltransferase